MTDQLMQHSFWLREQDIQEMRDYASSHDVPFSSVIRNTWALYARAVGLEYAKRQEWGMGETFAITGPRGGWRRIEPLGNCHRGDGPLKPVGFRVPPVQTLAVLKKHCRQGNRAMPFWEINAVAWEFFTRAMKRKPKESLAIVNRDGKVIEHVLIKM